MLGRTVSMAIGYGTAPIMARLFSPTDYGIAVLIEQIVLIAAAFSCLGYAQAIPLSTDERETRTLVRLCLLVTAALMVPVVLVAVPGADLLTGLLNDPAVRPFFWTVPVLVLLAALVQVGQYAFAKKRMFGWLSLMYLTNAGITRPFQICMGWVFGGSALFLLSGSILGNIVGVSIAAFLLVPLVLKKRTGDEAEGPRLLEVAKRHRQFPKVQVWNTVLNVLSLSLPVLLMGALFGTATVGYYGVAQKFLLLPLAILGTSIGQVFYPEAAAEWRETGSMSVNVHRTIRILAVTCIFPILAVALFGPILFATFLGPRWYQAGVYAQILSPWVLVILISSPISTVFLIRQRASTVLAYTVVLASMRPAALASGKLLTVLASPECLSLARWPGSPLPGFVVSIFEQIAPVASVVEKWIGGVGVGLLCFSGVGAIVFLHKLNLTMKLAKASRRVSAGVCLKEVVRALLLQAPAALTYGITGSELVSLALLGVAGVVHGALLYRREPFVREKIWGVLGRFIGNEPRLAEN